MQPIHKPIDCSLYDYSTVRQLHLVSSQSVAGNNPWMKHFCSQVGHMPVVYRKLLGVQSFGSYTLLQLTFNIRYSIVRLIRVCMGSKTTDVFFVEVYCLSTQSHSFKVFSSCSLNAHRDKNYQIALNMTLMCKFDIHCYIYHP